MTVIQKACGDFLPRSPALKKRRVLTQMKEGLYASRGPILPGVGGR